MEKEGLCSLISYPQEWMAQQVCRKTVIIPQCFPRMVSWFESSAGGFPHKEVVCDLNCSQSFLH